VLTSGTLLTFGSSEKNPGWVGPYGLGLFANDLWATALRIKDASVQRTAQTTTCSRLSAVMHLTLFWVWPIL